MIQINIDNVFTRMGSAIRHYAYKLNENNIKSLNLYFDGYIKNFDRESFKKDISYMISVGDTEVNYLYDDKQHKIKLMVREHGDVISCDTRCQSYFHTSMIVEVESREIFDNFLIDSYNYFNQYILKKSQYSNKINVYIYQNENWKILSRTKIRSLDTMYLPENTKEDLFLRLDKFLNPETEKWYYERGIPYKLNLVFHGYPGTGKTSLIRTIASKFNYNIAMVNFDSEMTDSTLMKSLQNIPEKSILVMEDIDVLFKARKENDEYKSNLSFSAILNCLDGLVSLDKLIVVMTTNYLCNLDKALVRSGRVDYSIEFSYADKHQIKQIYNKFFPESNEFNTFYMIVKKLNLTISQIQEYFINNTNMLNDKDISMIMENYSELEELSKKNEDVNINMYT